MIVNCLYRLSLTISIILKDLLDYLSKVAAFSSNINTGLFFTILIKGNLLKYLLLKFLYIYCYGPSVISVTVTTGGHLRGSRLYKTSRTMGRGVAELRS